MDIQRSTYYYRPKRNLCKKKRDADIADTIEKICFEHPYYGYRRITAALKRKGMVVNHKKVLKMMRKMSIQCRKRHKCHPSLALNHSVSTIEPVNRNYN